MGCCISVKAGLDVVCSLSCSLGDATAGLPCKTEQKGRIFFHTLLFCSYVDFRSANLTSQVFFFNEIVGVATSKNACELTE